MIFSGDSDDSIFKENENTRCGFSLKISPGLFLLATKQIHKREKTCFNEHYVLDYMAALKYFIAYLEFVFNCYNEIKCDRKSNR